MSFIISICLESHKKLNVYYGTNVVPRSTLTQQKNHALFVPHVNYVSV